MSPHERRIVAFLSQPRSYPHAAEPIERRETHVSHVFLAGPFAYKLKKPVKFPFLDASTPALRKKFCRLELSLNRRLAPHTYLGIVPIVERTGRLELGGRGKIVEWVVKMRRLPEDRMLDRLVAQRRVSRSNMEEIGRTLTTFFQRAQRSPAINRYGTLEAVAALLLGNLQECQPFVELCGGVPQGGILSERVSASRRIGSLLSETDRAFIEAAYRQYLTLYEPLLTQRLRQGRIIDGHGDLRCENICLPVRARPIIFDCVEFQPAFRCADMTNDLGFLVMDLEFRGRRDLAAVLAKAYQKRINDPTVKNVLPVYKCHRSLVRGKVRGFAWLQHPHTAHGRKIRELARRHFKLARRYVSAFAPPRLIMIGGIIGTGKSTLARSLSQALGATWLRTDEIRLTEFAHLRDPDQACLPAFGRRRQGFSEGLYAPRVSELVYRRLIQRAESLVRSGRSVVCDGTFSQAKGREALRRIARRHGASFHFFECVVPKTVALRRIAKRYASQSDISEAQPEHYERMRAGFEPVRGWSRRDWTRLSDNRAPAATYEAALRALRQAWAVSLPT